MKRERERGRARERERERERERRRERERERVTCFARCIPVDRCRGNKGESCKTQEVITFVVCVAGGRERGRERGREGGREREKVRGGERETCFARSVPVDRCRGNKRERCQIDPDGHVSCYVACVLRRAGSIQMAHWFCDMRNKAGEM